MNDKFIVFNEKEFEQFLNDYSVMYNITLREFETVLDVVKKYCEFKNKRRGLNNAKL